MLSPTFIVAFNQAFVRPILGKDGIVSAVSSKAKTAHPDVLAEFGFRIAASALQAGTSVKAVARDTDITEAANAAAAKRILEFRSALARIIREARFGGVLVDHVGGKVLSAVL